MTDAYTPYQHHGLWSPPFARVGFFSRETMRDIIERVADEYGLDYQDMIGRDRSMGVAHARQDAMHECWRTRRWSLPQIGRAFNRNHTTVLYGVRAHKRRAGL
jgi:chromosomal replication initiation ATPase DnaA